MRIVLDSAAAAQFQTSTYFAVVDNTATTSFSTTGAVGLTSTADMSDKNVRDIVDEMKKKNMPRYDGNNYICIASTNAIRGLYDYFEAKAQDVQPRTLFTGEIGTYYGCRFIEETNVLTNTNGLSSVYGEAVFIAGDAVREGIVIPEDIRIAIPADYGRDQGIAWYYLGGFVKTWDFGTDSESRIIYMTSKM